MKKKSDWVHRDYVEELEFSNLQFEMKHIIFKNILHILLEHDIVITHKLLEIVDRIANEQARVKVENEMYAAPIPA